MLAKWEVQNTETTTREMDAEQQKSKTYCILLISLTKIRTHLTSGVKTLDMNIHTNTSPPQTFLNDL